jgi:hypothetical protein
MSNVVMQDPSQIAERLLVQHANYWYSVDVYKACLLHSIVLHEALRKMGIRTELMQGYICYEGYASAHYWLRLHEHDYDVSMQILKIAAARMPKDQDKHTEVDKAVIFVTKTTQMLITESEYDASKYTRNDLDSDDEKNTFLELTTLYSDYLSNAAGFWDGMSDKPFPTNLIVKGREVLLDNALRDATSMLWEKCMSKADCQKKRFSQIIKHINHHQSTMQDYLTTERRNAIKSLVVMWNRKDKKIHDFFDMKDYHSMMGYTCADNEFNDLWKEYIDKGAALRLDLMRLEHSAVMLSVQPRIWSSLRDSSTPCVPNSVSSEARVSRALF